MTAAVCVSVAAALAWMYTGPVKGLVIQWMASPDASYGLLLACVALLVAWRRRRVFLQRADPASPPRRGLAILLAGLFLYLVGLLGADIFLTRVSLVAVIAGLVWFLCGRGSARVMAAPLVILLLAIPPPELVINAVTLPLQLFASRIAASTLSLAGIPVFRDGNVLELPSTSLEVAEACSGLRSLVSLTAVAALLAWATERSITRRAALVLAAVPLAIIMNAMRVTATAVVCETWGPRAASGSWHTFTGWITFVASVFLLVQVQRVAGPTGRILSSWHERACSTRLRRDSCAL